MGDNVQDTILLVTLEPILGHSVTRVLVKVKQTEHKDLFVYYRHINIIYYFWTVRSTSISTTTKNVIGCY